MTTPGSDDNRQAEPQNNHPDKSRMDQAEKISNESSAALYAIGALNEADRHSLEGKLFSGEIDTTDMQAHGETIVALCEDIAAVMPAPRRALKDSILQRVAELERAKQDPESQGSEATHIIKRADEAGWAELLPGIRVKVLFENPTTRRTTYLARLEPGASYPDHRHHGEEELLVLEGDIHLSGQTLFQGDYSVSIPDSEHRTVHSPHGCLCLVTSRMNDEFL